MRERLRTMKVFLSENSASVFGIMAGIVFVGVLGGYFVHVFRLGMEGKYVVEQPSWINRDSIVVVRNVGVVIGTDFTSTTSESSPAYVGITKEIHLPIGGGSNSEIYTKVFTDSGSFLLDGAHSINKGRKAKFARRFNKDELLLIEEPGGVDTFELGGQ